MDAAGTTEDLKLSLAKYHQRLSCLMSSISSAGFEMNEDITSLIDDLVELIAVTEQQIASRVDNSSTESETVSQPGSAGSDDGSPEENNVNPVEFVDNSDDVLHKVLAPHRSHNGTVEYLPAFYFDDGSADVNRKVFFLTPLTEKMQPCPDYPVCNRQQCRYSHGVELKASQLKKLTPPSYLKFQVCIFDCSARHLLA